MRQSWFHRLAIIGVFLTFIVVVLGAYVRLSDAGLGCPDWPGCYGQLVVPSHPDAVMAANEAHPQRQLESDKAWKEMAHRYFASSLGLLIMALVALAWRNRRDPKQPLRLPVILLAVVIFQGILGMWTVTWLLKPLVVMGHLLGGLTTLALMTWLVLRTGNYFAPAKLWQGRGLGRAAAWGLLVLTAQIALGGWTSTNYAALACPDFPACQGQWWPTADFDEAFVLWRGLGVNYEGGVLDSPARTAIHLTHRIGALVTVLYLGIIALGLIVRGEQKSVRIGGMMLAAGLLLQVSLGIASVLGRLPLPVAVAHNGGAAILLIILITVNHILNSESELV